MERVGGQLGGVAPLRREPTQGGGDPGRPDSRRLEHAGALRGLGDRGAGRDRRRAALRVEARRSHATPLDHEREANEVAARGAPGGAAVGAVRRRPAPRVIAQVVLEGLDARHRAPSVAGEAPSPPEGGGRYLG